MRTNFDSYAYSKKRLDFVRAYGEKGSVYFILWYSIANFLCISIGTMSMRPSVVLNLRRGAIREAASRFRTANPRIFGSVLHGTDRDGSDLDLLVDALPGVTLFDLGGLQDELESLLGVHVELLTPADLPPKLRAKVLAEAQPV